MRFIPAIAIAILMLASCKNSGPRKAVPASDYHEVLVEEVLQVDNYTYLRVNERGLEKWLAVPSMIASSGDTYYYRGGMEMEDFVSKDLERTFESVLFLGQLYTTPPPPETQEIKPETAHTGVMEAKKMDFSVDPAEDGITIAELYSGKKDFEGKIVRIRGAVTKFNADIMETNWIHIQDGTEHDGKFDLTVTSGQMIEPGEIIIVEGRISLDKDFGFGYYYEVIMEDAKIQAD